MIIREARNDLAVGLKKFFNREINGPEFVDYYVFPAIDSGDSALVLICKDWPKCYCDHDAFFSGDHIPNDVVSLITFLESDSEDMPQVR